MWPDACCESRRVCSSTRGMRFDTTHRKRAAANIFENVKQDALTRLFQRSGDARAEERVKSVLSTQQPEDTARALMALRQRKKDKVLQMVRTVRRFLKLR